MNSAPELDRIRSDTLDKMHRNEFFFKILVAISGIIELSGLVALVLLMDWGNRTHIVVFVAALLVYMTLGMWTWALAARNRVGEQRILRAVELLERSVAELRQQAASE